MLQITTAVREPVRVDLPGGGHILFKPPSTTGKAVARRAAMAAVIAGEDVAVANVAFSVALARWGAISWEGIGDQDGAPLPLTGDNVELLLEQSPSTFDAVTDVYTKAVLELETEKNVSAPGPIGTSPGSAAKKVAKARASRGEAATTAPAANRAQRRAAAKNARSS